MNEEGQRGLPEAMKFVENIQCKQAEKDGKGNGEDSWRPEQQPPSNLVHPFHLRTWENANAGSIREPLMDGVKGALTMERGFLELPRPRGRGASLSKARPIGENMVRW
jgi:hypothetical protein